MNLKVVLCVMVMVVGCAAQSPMDAMLEVVTVKEIERFLTAPGVSMDTCVAILRDFKRCRQAARQFARLASHLASNNLRCDPCPAQHQDIIDRFMVKLRTSGQCEQIVRTISIPNIC